MSLLLAFAVAGLGLLAVSMRLDAVNARLRSLLDDADRLKDLD